MKNRSKSFQVMLLIILVLSIINTLALNKILKEMVGDDDK